MSATDPNGHTAEEALHVWFADRHWRSPYRYSGLSIRTDSRCTSLADKAQILVTSGYVDHPVLVTIEGDFIESYRVDRFNGSVLTFDQSIDVSLSPTANVVASVFAGGAFVQQQQAIVVPPEEKCLGIEIVPDKSQYKPGDPANYTISVRDAKGHPADAELSFALVDEAIFAVQPDQTPDIRKFYYGQRKR